MCAPLKNNGEEIKVISQVQDVEDSVRSQLRSEGIYGVSNTAQEHRKGWHPIFSALLLQSICSNAYVVITKFAH